MHDAPVISTIAVGLALACVLALIAHRLRLPPIAGYLVAGMVIGPFTPGFVADQEIAAQLAEVGVILLMFGVGLHFSLRDLMEVRRIAVPGAIGRIVAATAVVVGMTTVMGWTIGAGLIFGLSLSVASTVVLLRALQENDLMTSHAGRIAIGWLIVEDLVMIFALVLVPPLAGLLGGDAQPVDDGAAAVARLGISQITATLLITTAKVVTFVALMLVVAVSPVQGWLIRNRVPRWVATVVVLLLLYLVLLALVGVLTVSIAQLATLLPNYASDANALLVNLTKILKNYNVGTEQITLFEQLLALRITDINTKPAPEVQSDMASVTPERGKRFQFGGCRLNLLLEELAQGRATGGARKIQPRKKIDAKFAQAARRLLHPRVKGAPAGGCKF